MNPYIKRTRRNQIDSVLKDPKSLLRLEYPCEEATLLAIKKDTGLISKVVLSEKLQKLLVDYNPRLVLFMLNPSEKTVLNALIREPEIIYLLSEPSLKAKTLAAKYLKTNLDLSSNFNVVQARQKNPYRKRSLSVC